MKAQFSICITSSPIIFIVMSLYSTAKLSHYSVDGTGRDSYINVNNGGIFRRFNPHKSQMFDFGSYKSKHVPRRIAPEITPKEVWYRNDGTGRDTYAMAPSLVSKRKNYLSSLRDYNINPELSCSFERSLSKEQEHSVRKLAAVKKRDDPYESMRSSFRVSIDKSWRKMSK